jgi:amylosucrase
MNEAIIPAQESFRSQAWREGVAEALTTLYGERRVSVLLDRFEDLVARNRGARPAHLLRRDAALPRDWYRDSTNAVYVLYADRFCPEAPRGRKLAALRDELPYFQELGMTILHVLPILASTGDDGFAVRDYRQIDEAIGDNDDCIELIQSVHDRGMWIALDFVLNHVADEHAWATRAKAGDPAYLDHFIWDASGTGRPWDGVRDVFTEFAPGHWDYVPELDKYVWATFYKRRPADRDGRWDPQGPRHAFAQWDLNYANPEVLFAMVENLLFLANWGVDVFRLDAVPHIWKQQGTDCKGRPEARLIVRLFRAALDVVAPRAVLLAEANQRYEQVIAHFDRGRGVHIAYHFSLMPALWQAAINGTSEAIERELARMPTTDPADHAWWWIFSECHDEVGLSTVDRPTLERLWDYFRADGGGLPFKVEPGGQLPRAVSGTTYSLLHGDIEKIVRLWELKLKLAATPKCRGTPLFYMGEELGVENLPLDASTRHDTRFTKRVPLTRELKARRLQPGTKENGMFQRLRALLAGRNWRQSLGGAGSQSR